MKTMSCPLLVLMLAASAQAGYKYETVDGIRWGFMNEGNVATIGKGQYSVTAIDPSTSGAISIPAKLGGLPVVGINDYALGSCSSITSVIIPDGVKFIGKSAFSGAIRLNSVIIPGSVTNIGESAFYDCSYLQSVVISEGVVSIGNGAFHYCSRLPEIFIPATVTSIGEKAFRECGSLKTVGGMRGVRTIGGSAFAFCDSLESVMLGNDLTSVGSNVFDYCGRIRSVSLPSRFQVSSVFTDDYAKITNAIVTDGSANIPSSMFSGCTQLSSVTIPSTVTNIESKAFADCTNLDTVRIADLAAWCGIAFGSFDANPLYYAKHLFVNGTEVKDLVVPDGVVTIRKYAFRGFSGLLSVTLPDSVKSVGGAVFRGCANLASADLGKGLKLLGGTSFADCPALASVSVPNTVTTVDTGAFSGCTAIATATFPGRLSPQTLFPDSWSGIRTAAFAEGTEWVTNSVFEGCTALTDITVPSSVTNMGSKAFHGCTALDTVRTDDLAAWCHRFYQSGDATPLYYAKHFVVDGTEVTDLVVPDGVWTIRRYAFRGFKGLRSLTLPDSVESIGGAVFRGCSNLESANLGNGLKLLGGNSFCACTSLTTLVVPPKVQTIDSNAFDGATGLETIYLPRRFEGQTDPMSIVPTCTIYFYGDIEALSVPEDWLDRYELAAGGDNIAAAEAVAANGVNKVWECYVAGLDPTNALSRFEARIAMEEGDPVVTWSPDLRPDRVYAVFGATEPGAKESAWADVTSTPHLDQTDFRFFKVKVSLKEE